MTAQSDKALNILGLVQSYEQTPMGKVWGISAKTLQTESGLSESVLDDLLDVLLSNGDLKIHPDNKGFVLGASGKERLYQASTDTTDTADTNGLDEITLTPAQAEHIRDGLRRTLKARVAGFDGDITQALEAWYEARRAITKTHEYGGFNSPFTSISRADAMSAIESASSLADRLRRLADGLERESESYRNMIEDMR